MFRQVNVEILGVVENMSYFTCPHCGERIDIFGHGEGAKTADAYGVPFLGEIEIDPANPHRRRHRQARRLAWAKTLPARKSIYAMARNVIARVDTVNASATSPVVQIL